MSAKSSYRNARFLTTAVRAAQFPADSGSEIAFAGRSNAGKSSAINALCGQKSLARTSKTPGRTQALNFFQLSETQRLVDLPGYGYAKVPAAMQRSWQALMSHYLGQRACLRGMIIVMDIRHPLSDYDWQLLELCGQFALPCHILLTKADKLKRGRRLEASRHVAATLDQHGVAAGLQTFSALKMSGLAEATAVMDQWLENDCV